MSDISGHAILKIVKGVQRVPGDALSAEIGLDEIDLLDENGFACDDYDMKLPALKSSAVYADSPLTDGRTLISGTLGNVTETIRLQLTAGSIIQMAAMLSKLGRFKQDCNDFWDTFGQIEPVYIKHQVIGEPGPRYALLYDIDIDPGEQPLIPSEAKRTVTLVIERETDWSVEVAPGANPKKWTAFKNDADFDSAYATLYEGGSHIAYSTVVSNAIEFSGYYTINTGNYIDIPAASIPGDAPARVTIAMGDFPDTTELYIAKTTKPTSLTDRLGNVRPLFNDIPCSGAAQSSGSVLTLDATNGIVYTPVSTARRTVIHTSSGAAEELTMQWRPGSVFLTGLNLSLLRGRYAVFLRALQILGTAGQTTARVEMLLNISGLKFFDSGQIRMGLSGSESNLMYMGVATIPFDNQTFTAFNGLGVQADSDFSMRLYTTRSAGTSTQRLVDVILMPIDEGMVYIKPEVSTSTTVNIFDNTGYLTHGKPEPFASARDFTSQEQPWSTECRGDLTLTPGVNNRLYFLAYNPNTLDSNPGAGVGTPVRINIVPRVSGLRGA